MYENIRITENQTLIYEAGGHMLVISNFFFSPDHFWQRECFAPDMQIWFMSLTLIDPRKALPTYDS